MTKESNSEVREAIILKLPTAPPKYMSLPGSEPSICGVVVSTMTTVYALLHGLSSRRNKEGKEERRRRVTNHLGEQNRFRNRD